MPQAETCTSNYYSGTLTDSNDRVHLRSLENNTVAAICTNTKTSGFSKQLTNQSLFSRNCDPESLQLGVSDNTSSNSSTCAVYEHKHQDREKCCDSFSRGTPPLSSLYSGSPVPHLITVPDISKKTKKNYLGPSIASSSLSSSIQIRDELSSKRLEGLVEERRTNVEVCLDYSDSDEESACNLTTNHVHLGQ